MSQPRNQQSSSSLCMRRDNPEPKQVEIYTCRIKYHCETPIYKASGKHVSRIPPTKCLHVFQCFGSADIHKTLILIVCQDFDNFLTWLTYFCWKLRMLTSPFTGLICGYSCIHAPGQTKVLWRTTKSFSPYLNYLQLTPFVSLRLFYSSTHGMAGSRINFLYTTPSPSPCLYALELHTLGLVLRHKAVRYFPTNDRVYL